MKESLEPNWTKFMTETKFREEFPEHAFRGPGWYPSKNNDNIILLIQETDYMGKSDSPFDRIHKDHCQGRPEFSLPVYRASVWFFDVRELMTSLLTLQEV